MKLHKLQATPEMMVYAADMNAALSFPFMDSPVSAGFPSPAEVFADRSIDLNQELIKHPETTFYCRVSGDSMKDIGIGDGDLHVVDKSLKLSVSFLSSKMMYCFL